MSAKKTRTPSDWPYVKVGNMRFIGFVGPGNDELERLDKAVLRLLLEDPHPHRWRARLEKTVRWRDDADPGKQAFARAILLSLALQDEAAKVLNHPPAQRKRYIERINNYWSLYVSGRVRGRRDDDRGKRIMFMRLINEAVEVGGDVAGQVERVLAGCEKLNLGTRREIDEELVRTALTFWPHKGGRYKGDRAKGVKGGSPKWDSVKAAAVQFLPGVDADTFRTDWSNRDKPSRGAAVFDR